MRVRIHLGHARGAHRVCEAFAIDHGGCVHDGAPRTCSALLSPPTAAGCGCLSYRLFREVSHGGGNARRVTASLDVRERCDARVTSRPLLVRSQNTDSTAARSLAWRRTLGNEPSPADPMAPSHLAQSSFPEFQPSGALPATLDGSVRLTTLNTARFVSLSAINDTVFPRHRSPSPN
ncbi:hypothetical protein PMIN01_10386 [Paraphaeosphaeria minitans]|uniref:Uncharacterized protein n=1 Tax=Paraphaeosphaeria minitans TaxID=565426 RepID=A0A9P6G9M6_9PLEO|nr:hypothetical protein PMIN01_10386 [Paraphaeosphaeria minitans]